MGVVLYEVLAGRCPWVGDNYNALIVEISFAPIPRLDQKVRGIPMPLANIVHRALERDPSLRYRSMQHFLGDLLDCPTLENETWRSALRNSHSFAMEKTVAAQVLTPVEEEPTTRKNENVARVASAFDEGPGWAPSAREPQRTTIGQTAREIPAGVPQRSSRAVVVSLSVLVVVAGISAVALTVSRDRTRNSPATSSRPSATWPSAPATTAAGPAAPPPVALSASYIVNLAVQPPTATIELDGVQTGRTRSPLGSRSMVAVM